MSNNKNIVQMFVTLKLCHKKWQTSKQRTQNNECFNSMIRNVCQMFTDQYGSWEPTQRIIYHDQKNITRSVTWNNVSDSASHHFYLWWVFSFSLCFPDLGPSGLPYVTASCNWFWKSWQTKCSVSLENLIVFTNFIRKPEKFVRLQFCGFSGSETHSKRKNNKKKKPTSSKSNIVRVRLLR